MGVPIENDLILFFNSVFSLAKNDPSTLRTKCCDYVDESKRNSVYVFITEITDFALVSAFDFNYEFNLALNLVTFGYEFSK
jgi:hypothetical protein